MKLASLHLLAAAGVAAAADVPGNCPGYDVYAAQRHPPYSPGRFKYPSQRPEVKCRSYVVPDVDKTIAQVKGRIKDPDLYSLFANTWPNTVDTTILWHGRAADDADQEDDANIPSLLSIPHLGFKANTDRTYQRTRDFVLSRSNPYYGFGPVLNATGGPHLGPGMAWPMGVVMQIMTSDHDDEIVHGIKQLMGATSGLGLIHESVNTWNDQKWTRPWFAWANGLFGQMILDLLNRKPHLLARTYQ